MRRKPASSTLPFEPPAFVAPYPPSWVNRLADRVDRWPGPSWLPYAMLGAGLAAVQTAIQWSAGTYPIGAVDPFNLVVALAVPYLLALMHYLLRTAAGSLDTFRPALRATPAETADLSYRMATLPARGARRASLAVALGALAIVLLTSLAGYLGVGWLSDALGGDILIAWPRVYRIAPTPLSFGFTAIVTLTAWLAIGAYAYLSLHQLRLIDWIYTHHTDLRLFRLGPLYALSRHTLRSAVGLLILAYGFFATAPEVVGSAVGGASWLLLVSGALAVFLIPLPGIHRLLVQEKNRLLDEVGARMETGTGDLHRRMDAHDLARMDDLNKALASLELERAALERVPTWPWERGTLRSLTAAILIPVVIWAIQALLQPLLAR